jgi:plasmid maintenance system killer protein
MLELIFAPIFFRELNKLETNLKDEVFEKIELFKNLSNHKQLKVHKLHGQFRNQYSFSVNYKYRIVFSYSSKSKVNILSVGDHSIYN